MSVTPHVLELFSEVLVISSQYRPLEPPHPPAKKENKKHASTSHFRRELETNSIYNSPDKNRFILLSFYARMVYWRIPV